MWKNPSHGSALPVENLTSRVLGIFPNSPQSQSPAAAAAAAKENLVQPPAIAADNTVVIGILQKWVNIGRGWNFRLFILEKGVLSYYKLDGLDCALVSKEVAKRPGARFIGEETEKAIKREKLSYTPNMLNEYRSGSPLGEVHLQVSTVRASDSDEKKFYVFSGTKTLFLRAGSKQERQAWLDTLLMLKEFFNMAPSMVDLPPLDPIRISTLPLREKMLAAGVADSFVTECEDIVKNQIFSSLWSMLKKERQQKRKLLSKLKQLEVDKQELETQVVQETLFLHGESSLTKSQFGVQTEESDDTGHGEPGESDGYSDTEFYEAVESFSAGLDFPRVDSDLALSTIPYPNPTADVFRCGPSPETLDMEEVGLRYPPVARRKKLPEPKQAERPTSLWSIIKDNVGKDLSHICLPVYFNEPISTLQKCFEDVEYSDLLDKAAEYGRRGNQIMRAVCVATFAASSYAGTAGRGSKPFNPLLGETYEAVWEDKGMRFIAEKVSHHPNVMALHCEGHGWKFWADSNLKNRFWGPSITLEPTGVISLLFDDGELFEWTKVTTGIYNIILGKPYVDHYGTMNITGNRGFSMVMNFKQPSMIDRHQHQVRGFVRNDSSGEKVATLVGKWDESIHFVLGDLPRHKIRPDASSMPGLTEMWRKSPPSKYPTRYNLSSFAIALNEITPGLEEWLPPTDCRLRPDQRALEEGDFDFANDEKLRLEQKQRLTRKLQQATWSPRWFAQKGPHNTWTYTGEYWERRAKKDWSGVLHIYDIKSLMASLGETKPE